jgi:3-oxoacyl-[acyl-carrier-protein] synthase-3
METDSEAMLQAGNALAARTFEAFLREMEWKREDVDRVVTHQVGSVHRKLLLETLGLAEGIDFPTVETLGNTGSAALPVAFSMAEEAGFLRGNRRIAMLGIGSGLSCLMLGVEARS